jgi:glycosyltransferase involved in cell wall biosynthesis
MRELRRRVIGVWTEWESELNWTTTGIARLLAFLVEGAAQSDGLSFRFIVTPINHQAARDMFSCLKAQEGEHWSVHSLTPTPAADLTMASECDVPYTSEGPQVRPLDEAPDVADRTMVSECDTLTTPERSLPPSADPADFDAPKHSLLSRWVLSLAPATMRVVLATVCLVTLPLQVIRVFLRPIWRFFWQCGLSAVPVQMGILAASLRDPFVGANELGIRLSRAPFGLAALGLALRQWSEVNTPPPPPPQLDDEHAPPGPAQRSGLDRQADFANAEIEVDGWLLIGSNCVHGLGLNGRRVALFPDAIPIEFAASYNPGRWADERDLSHWRYDTQRTLLCADSIIAFSKHVARRHLCGLFGIAPQRICIVPHAPADLSSDLPSLAPDRRRTPESLRRAADCLRHHALERQWPYLTEFPFEDVSYVAVSAPDRPTKNISLVVAAILRLIRRDYYQVKLVMTSAIADVSAPGCLLPAALREANMQLDAVSMPGLSKTGRAAFYHCAAVTVHPSLFEGGDTVLQFSESVSVGTPCLMARGPHTDELLESYPELDQWVFDPYDDDGLAQLIDATIADRDNALTKQLECYARMTSRSWAQVASEYADAVMGNSGQAINQGVPA